MAAGFSSFRKYSSWHWKILRIRTALSRYDIRASGSIKAILTKPNMTEHTWRALRRQNWFSTAGSASAAFCELMHTSWSSWITKICKMKIMFAARLTPTKMGDFIFIAYISLLWHIKTSRVVKLIVMTRVSTPKRIRLASEFIGTRLLCVSNWLVSNNCILSRFWGSSLLRYEIDDPSEKFCYIMFLLYSYFTKDIFGKRVQNYVV